MAGPADGAGLCDLHRSAPGPGRRPGALRRRTQRGYGRGLRVANRRRQEALIMGRNAQRRRAAPAAQRQPVQSRPVLFYDVELWHLDDEPELSWSAEGAISGDRSGARFESTDTLAELVADVVNEVREISQARGGTAIGVTWYMAELIDDAEGAERMVHALAAAEGVELPARGS